MKKLLLLTSLLMMTNCFAGELKDYLQVKTAVTQGQSIRIATDFSKCTSDTNSKSLQKYLLGVFSPNSIVIDNAGKIKSSLKHFSLNDPNVPGKPVYQYVAYVLNQDNSIKISVNVLDAVSYAPIKATSVVNCTIADGVSIYTH